MLVVSHLGLFFSALNKIGKGRIWTSPITASGKMLRLPRSTPLRHLSCYPQNKESYKKANVTVVFYFK